MKKYLITGYSGFVSAHFLDYLEEKQIRCEVLGVDIAPPANRFTSFSFVKTRFEPLNLLDKEHVASLLRSFQPDYILHLASYSSVAGSWKQPVESFVNNTNIFLNLADQVRLMQIPCRILSVGSSEEYGKVTHDMLPLTESLPINPISPYAVARVSQEMLSKIYADSYGLDIVLTRSFNHIGPGQKDIFVVSSFAKKLVALKYELSGDRALKVGDLSIIRDFVDVRDVVRAYYMLLENGKKGTMYNICSGTGYSLRQVLEQMMVLMGNLQVDIQADPALIRPADNQVIIGSYEKIRNDLGWEPEFGLEQSLCDVIRFWEQIIQSGSQ